MGGGSFDHRAERLTTAHLTALEAHCIKTLQPFFRGIKALRNLDTKATHGDLDLMVASEQMTRGVRWTGYDAGVIDPADQSNLMYDVQDSARGERKLGNADVEYKVWREWFTSIAKAVGAVQWNRSGGTSVKVAVAIPCKLVGVHIEATEGIESIFQVDICLLPPDEYLFSWFIKSYGIVRITLASAVKFLIKDVALTINHLRTSYTPYDGLPAVETVLSASPPEVCAWLGLDFARWEQGFATVEDLYLWLSTVPEDSVLGMAHDKMGREQLDTKHSGSKKEAKLPEWKLFIEWLRADKDSPWRAPDTLAVVPVPPAIEVGNIIDPEKPNALDDLAREAINRWGRWNVFEKEIRERKAVAVIRAQQQRRRSKPNAPNLSTITRKISSMSLSPRPHTPVML